MIGKSTKKTRLAIELGSKDWDVLMGISEAVLDDVPKGWYTVPDIAESRKISMTSVRRKLRRLEQLDLVESKKYRVVVTKYGTVRRVLHYKILKKAAGRGSKA